MMVDAVNYIDGDFAYREFYLYICILRSVVIQEAMHVLKLGQLVRSFDMLLHVHVNQLESELRLHSLKICHI